MRRFDPGRARGSAQREHAGEGELTPRHAEGVRRRDDPVEGALGLRHEEMAELCLMSADHFARLERGDGPQPSERMLAAIARGLRLTPDRRGHLFLTRYTGNARSATHRWFTDPAARGGHHPEEYDRNSRTRVVLLRAAVARDGPRRPSGCRPGR